MTSRVNDGGEWKYPQSAFINKDGTWVEVLDPDEAALLVQHNGESKELLYNGDAEYDVELVDLNAASGGSAANFNMTAGTTVYTHSGQPRFRVINDSNILSSEFIKVERDFNYQMEGRFESIGAGQSVVYFGLAEYDKNKNFISYNRVNWNENAVTTLSADLTPGSLIVPITSEANFSGDISNNYYATQVGIFIDDIEIADTVLSYSSVGVGVLNLPVAYSGPIIPAGTVVKNCVNGPTYNYVGSLGTVIPKAPTFSRGYIGNWGTNFNVSDVNEIFNSYSQFRHGTEFVKINILANYGQTAAEILTFDNVSLQRKKGIVDNGVSREWEDGTHASSVWEYRNPPAGYTYAGEIGDGMYRIDPLQNGTTYDVYADMTTDGGGWTLVDSVGGDGNNIVSRTSTINTTPDTTTGSILPFSYQWFSSPQVLVKSDAFDGTLPWMTFNAVSSSALNYPITNNPITTPGQSGHFTVNTLNGNTNRGTDAWIYTGSNRIGTFYVGSPTQATAAVGYMDGSGNTLTGLGTASLNSLTVKGSTWVR